MVRAGGALVYVPAKLVAFVGGVAVANPLLADYDKTKPKVEGGGNWLIKKPIGPTAREVLCSLGFGGLIGAVCVLGAYRLIDNRLVAI